MILSPALAEHFLFFPSREDPGRAPVLAGVQGEDVEPITADGVRLHGWWFGSGPGAPVVLFLHGNAGHLGDRTPIVAGLVERGLSVLIIDYRGYGRSEGAPTLGGVVVDARAGYDLAVARAGSEARVAIYGRSLGGAVAAQLAREAGAGALVLESTFTSLRDAAASSYSYFPDFLFVRLGGILDTRAAVAETDVPVLVVHGTRDEFFPTTMARRLHEAARGPAEWFEIPGARHNDTFIIGGDAYYDRLAAFIRRWTVGPPASRDASPPPPGVS